MKLLADRSYKAGQPLFTSFGLKSSAECLEDHGIGRVGRVVTDSAVLYYM